MDAEDDLRSGDLLGRAGEADEAGMEVGDVAGEQRGSVARGIDGDEERLHLRRRGAQGVQRRGQLGKLGRADVGTGGVAEVDQQEAAAEVLLGDRAAVMVDEREGTADILLEPKGDRKSTRLKSGP